LTKSLEISEVLIFLCALHAAEGTILFVDPENCFYLVLHMLTYILWFLQMLKKLNKQLNGDEWAWNTLNTLCWAIGSISGSMVEDQVNFPVT
jgi:hypothetical protein